MSRVSRVLFAVVMASACGGKATPPPAPMSAPLPVALAPEPTAPTGIAVAPVTCADAGVLLARTFSSYDDAMITKHEGEIAKACTAAHWPQAVLDCLGATITETEKCVDQLPHDAQVALVSSITRPPPPKEPEPPEDENKFTPCEAAIAAPEAFGPPGEGSADDVAFQTALRKAELVDACNDDGWNEHAKECFAKAKDADRVGTCIRKLPDHAQTGATSAIIAAMERSQKTFEARKVPANITCAKVVAKHYSDAAWKDKLTRIKAGDKKTAVTASRAKMTKLCTADKWSPTLRACVVSGGEYRACSMTTGTDPWGYPAFGVIVPTGVPACDKYIGAIAKLAECPEAKEMRDALLQMVSSATSTMAEMSEDSRKIIAEACTQGLAAVEDQSKRMGCKP